MISLDSKDRREFYEFESLVEDIEEQAELYERTDDYRIDGDPGPVTLELAEYVLAPGEQFLEMWNSVHDSVKDECERRSIEKRYRELQDTLFENQDFIEAVYDLQKPLGRAKIEAGYPW